MIFNTKYTPKKKTVSVIPHCFLSFANGIKPITRFSILKDENGIKLHYI